MDNVDNNKKEMDFFNLDDQLSRWKELLDI